VVLLGVLILQFLERVPDRQAVELVKYHLGWKLALNLWGVFDLADRCKLELKPWKRTIRNQGVNLADALTKSLSVMRLGCWNLGFGRPSSWP